MKLSDLIAQLQSLQVPGKDHELLVHDFNYTINHAGRGRVCSTGDAVMSDVTSALWFEVAVGIVAAVLFIYLILVALSAAVVLSRAARSQFRSWMSKCRFKRSLKASPWGVHWGEKMWFNNCAYHPKLQTISQSTLPTESTCIVDVSLTYLNSQVSDSALARAKTEAEMFIGKTYGEWMADKRVKGGNGTSGYSLARSMSRFA